jgi:RNA-binding protein 39
MAQNGEDIEALLDQAAATTAAPPPATEGGGERDNQRSGVQDGHGEADCDRDRNQRDHRRDDDRRDRRDYRRDDDRRDRDRRDYRRDDDYHRRDRRRSPSPRRRRSPSPDPVAKEQEEAMRDDLTVLVQRIHPRADDFEIFEFFSQAGKVRDIRLIRDQRSNKSKGIGYVEFADPQGVLNALAFNGIAFKGQPLLVQASMAEKNRLAQAAKNVAAASALMGGAAALAVPETPEPTKLICTELHPNISQQDVSDVFSPFGEVLEIIMPTDQASDARLGIAHITYKEAAAASAAQQALNGLELAGKGIVVQLVAEAPPPPPQMLQVPQVPNTLPNMMPNMGMPGMMMPGMVPGMPAMPGMMMPGMMGMVPGMAMPGMAGGAMPPGAMPTAPAPPGGLAAPGPPSVFVLLRNMFDPDGDDEKNDEHFFDDLEEDVAEEVGKHGSVERCAVLRGTQGQVVVQFAAESGAAACAGALNGRWFSGKQISAATVEEAEAQQMLNEARP